ncbi:class I SAM-dependent methyltransferase [Mesorhizobium sp. M0293]|uniref:class I SAM-dependent methyltransferase n=1 Tax=Mesorhizobium sp. M0293 TaxID=2956930 RepID=UPI003339878A
MEDKFDPHGETRIEVDDPQDRVLRHPINSIDGWIAIPVEKTIAVSLSGLVSESPAGALRVAFYPRVGLDPGAAVGFTAYLDLCGLQLRGRSLTIKFISNDAREVELDFGVTDEAIGLAASYHSEKGAKEIKLRSLFKGRIERDSRCFAPSALPDGWTVSPVLEEKRDAVSSHLYGPVVNRFLSEFPSGSIFLDAGAGLRKRPLSNVFSTDIYDYPSTDVISIGQDLPFKDESFDGVLSLAVLEHVDDPFLCARELARVLKPKGRVLVMMPFLQAEHGYPQHYFNATRSGVVKLFEDLMLKDQMMTKSNHPILTINQIVGTYLSGVDEELRGEFSEMPVRRLFELAAKHMRDEPDDMLNIEAQKALQIAWGTTSVFEKQ